MHPSHAIRGRTTKLLDGRRIVLGITGSIAAVEVPKIARELIRHGADVRAVMSPDAVRIITPEAVEFATGHPPILRLSGNVEHVTLLGPGEGRADLFLIAPATANTIAKVAHGIDDTVVTSCASVALGGNVPILVAPAMHSLMGENPAVRESREKLSRWGVSFLFGPRAEGEAKVASPEEVAAAVIHTLARGPWRGRRVTVIGGAAREAIDAVRSVTNESSGTTAVAWATQAYFRGAEVELWAGSLEVPVPSWIPMTRWRGVSDLLALARRRRADLTQAAAIVVPAALSDFTLRASPGKIPSRGRDRLTLELTRAPKVLPELRKLAPAPTRLVAFKLLAGATESALEQEGRLLQEETGADWVVANDSSSMGSADTAALVLSRGEGPRRFRGPKPEVAGKLLDDLGRELANLPVVPLPRRKAGSRKNAGRGRPIRR
ncbi:MAG: bifunctional phosphopantothenoylcysteine decarboxylase/phosphopantothenate--cysteine ligase CoaBC [Thermoplasmata archaeon]